MTVLSALKEGFLPWLRLPFGQPRATMMPVVGVDDLAFQHAITAMAAKLAMVDGAPQASEYAAFDALFPFASRDALKLRSLFVKHTKDASSILQYARQIRAMGVDVEMREEILRRLLQLANCDAPMNAAELELLASVSRVWGMDKEAFRAQVNRFMVAQTASPYEILRVSKRASMDEVRARYLEQVRVLHPDQYMAAGASTETVAILNDRLAAVNAAFEAITRARGEKRGKLTRTRQGLRNTKSTSD